MARDLVIIEAEGKLRHLYQIFAEIGYHADLFATMGFFMDNPKSMRCPAIQYHEGEFIEPYRAPIRPDAFARFKHTLRSCEGRIIIATDNDAEGHVIAADVANLCRQEVPHLPVFRALFNAMDKDTIKRGLTSLSVVDPALANAGTARRITDRLIGLSFSDFSAFSPVGRIQSPLLGLAQAGIATAFNTVSLPSTDQRAAFHATLPTASSPAELIAQLDGLTASPASSAVSPLSSPLTGGDALLLVSRGIDVSIIDAAALLQSMYEAGEISYPRTQGNGYSLAGMDVIASIASIKGVIGFKKGLLPPLDAASNHEAVRIMSPDSLKGVNIALPPKLQPSERAAALALIAASNVQAGIPVKKEIAAVDVARLPAELQTCQWSRVSRIALPWQLVEPRHAGKLTAEQAVLTAMLEQGLGRPATLPMHVRRFIDRGGVDADLHLTERGRGWLMTAPPSLRSADVARQIDRLLDGAIGDSQKTVASLVLNALDCVVEGDDADLQRIISNISTVPEPLGPEVQEPEPQDVIDEEEVDEEHPALRLRW